MVYDSEQNKLQVFLAMFNALLRNTAAPDAISKNTDFGGLTYTVPNPSEHEMLADRLFCLFISIKNRLFTREYIKRFVNACNKGNYRGMICAVDEPYIYNRMAELAMDTLATNESAKIYQLSKEVTRKAEKVIRGTNSENINLTNWATLSASTPNWMKEEVATAYQQKSVFYSHIRGHVAEIKANQNDACLDRYARFFLCEIPVLIHSYYRHSGGVVDVYPGPNADLFLMIEHGYFEEELPQMTAFARAGRPLSYLDTGTQQQK